MAATAIGGLAGWIERQPLFAAAANAWIVSDPPIAADAAVVFGGNIEDRPFAAAEYYRAGLVKKVLVSNVRLGPAERLGVVKPEAETIRAILLQSGVAERDIEVFGDSLATTHDECLALRHWADRNGGRRFIVPTEIFSARRVRWMLLRALGDGFTVAVPALESVDYRRDHWWRDSAGVMAFQNEIIKYVYYRLKY